MSKRISVIIPVYNRAKYIKDAILTKKDSCSNASKEVRRYIEQVKNFVLWHYQGGSKYDTPFWDYAKSLTFKDEAFDAMLYESRTYDKYGIMPKSYGGYTTDGNEYGQWSPYSFKVWYQGMTEQLTDKSSLV